MAKNPHAVALGRKGGASTSERKADAARENGQSGGRPRRQVDERFWSHVQKTDDCWLWLAAKTAKGYGLFQRKGSERAHRVAYELTHGSIPDGLSVLHRCDNPPCVRPDHLFVGTHGDNNRDRSKKGRDASGDSHGTRTHPEKLPRGMSHGNHKLTDESVRQIRAAYASGQSAKALSRQFGVCLATVTNVISRRIWRHVD